MANATGLGSGFSAKKESVWGTAVTPTVAIPIVGYKPNDEIKRIESKTLKGGTVLDSSSSWRVGGALGSAELSTLLFSSGATFLWEAMLGTLATTGSGPYVHTASPLGALPSYTLEASYGGITSSYARHRAVGAMVDSWEVKAALDLPVTLGVNWAYKSGAMAASTALDGSYPASQTPFVYTGVVITGGAVPAGCVESLTIKGENNLLKDQMCLGSSTITQPARNGIGTISGSMDVLLLSNSVADFALYTGGTELSLIATMTNGTHTCVITMNVRVDGSTPPIDGEGVIKVTIPFKVLAPTTDASGFTVVVTNGDATA